MLETATAFLWDAQPLRVLLASAPHADTFGYSMPPPGLLRLGGTLRERGVEVVLEDLAYRLAAGDVPAGDAMVRGCAERLASANPEVVGLSTMGATLPAAIAIAEELRGLLPNTRLVIGGPGAGGVDIALLERFPFLDLVVRGEAEVTLPEVLERWASGRDLQGVMGITRRGEGGAALREPDRAPIELADVSPYAWDLLPPLTSYKAITGEDEGLTPIDSGRGCVYDCSFCSIGRYWGRRSRPLPARRLADEVLALQEHPGARHAYLCHDLFGTHRQEALEFCQHMSAAGSPVPWECRARLDHLDAELYEAMQAAGCYRVLLGVESADPAVRRTNQKGMRDEVDLLAGVDACVDAGITPILSLILGLPGEEESGLASTLDFCADAVLRAGVNLSLHLANPQPGCALGDEYSEASRPVPGIPPDMAFGAGETGPEQELIQAHPDLFSTWHLLPWDEERLQDLRALATDLPEVLMRYPRTFSVLRKRRGEDALTLYKAWRATGRSFDAFALCSDDPLVLDVLDWERASVRAAARGGAAAQALDPERGAQASVEVVHAAHDLAAVTPALREGAPLPATGGAHAFAIGAVPGPLAGIRTVRLSNAAASLIEDLDGQVPLATLETRRPGMTTALTRLAEAGLVTAT